MLCNKCYSTPCNCGCSECEDSCPIKLDFSCILYNKDGKDASNLTGLGLPNGSSLKIVAELLDQKVKQLNVIGFSLPNLRNNYTITNLKQFSEAVDTELSNIQDSIFLLNQLNTSGVIGIDSSTINFTVSGSLNNNITAEVKIAPPDTANCLTLQSTGLVAVPQNLSINYATKQISISKGNTINLSGLFTSSYLGNVTSDPAGAIDGNYWYNTAQSKLKIKVNNTVKEILTA